MIVRSPDNPQLGAQVEPRKQSPTGNALNVQIGPGDVISNIPVIIEFEHHQVHEGETFIAQDVQSGLGSSTVKYSIDVPTYTHPTEEGPHFVISADVYNGTVLVQVYEGSTYTGGSVVPKYNRNRNSSNTSNLVINTGVTSTNGTLIKSFYAGAGKSTSGGNRSDMEIILKSGATYRIDIIGQAAGTAAITGFHWYEDLGV